MKFLFPLFFVLLFYWSLIPANSLAGEKNVSNENSTGSYNRYLVELYSKCELDGKLDFKVFCRAIAGYSSINTKHSWVISIVDFSKPSADKRLFIIDLEDEKLLCHTFVAH